MLLRYLKKIFYNSVAELRVKEKPKRTRKTQKSAKEKPYVEQINELLFVHNKEDPKAGVQAVSEIDGEGKVRTVPAEEKNENSFLKFEKNSSILENFIRNFWSQLKEPTHFRLIRMTIHDYKQNRQAIKDLSQGKETKIKPAGTGTTTDSFNRTTAGTAGTTLPL